MGDVTGESDRCLGLDPEWIAEQLATDERRPAEVTFGGFIGTGQMSRNARFDVRWADGDGPASVVVKVPSSDPKTRTVSFDHGVYANECHFYAAVKPLVDIATPGVLAVHHDADQRDFVVLLEDMAGSEQGDQFTEPGEAQLRLAIEQAAKLHAPVWGHTADPVFDTYRHDPTERAASAAQMIPLFLGVVFDRLGAGLDPEVVELLERFPAVVAPWTRARSVPTTLVHGDFRPDNFLFGVSEAAPPIVVVDWQTLGLGLGVTDIAYLLGGALEPGTRRQVEDDLLGSYVEELGSRGVRYPMAQCLEEYALGSVHGIVVAITATVMADETERGDALFTLMLNRHGRHALDLQALERVEGSG